MAPVDNNVALENVHARVDIWPKITGAAKYTADQQPAGMLHATFIQFPFGGGRIRSANVEAARAVPGVLEVELEAGRAARFNGDRMGHIVADSREALGDAMEALALEWAPRSPEVRASALYAGVPAVDAESQAALDGLFSRAAVVVEATYETQVQTHACLETHGGVVHHQGDKAVAWGSTQGTFAYRDGLARPLELDASKVQVLNEFVGGGFGSKFGPDAEGDLAARLSRKFGKPCRVMCDRKQEHMDTGNRPGSIQFMKIGASADGKLLGGRIHVASIVGHTEGRGGARNPVLYEFGEVERTEADIVLPAGLPRAMRSPGWPQGVFAVESMMDELAAALKMDPLEFRRRNDPSPRRLRQMERGAALIGWDKRQPDGAGTGRVKRGLGYGGTTWGFRNVDCQAEAEVHRSGKVVVRGGVQDIGQGAATVVTDTAADELGLPREAVTGFVGNSDYPPGPASGGSVTTFSASPAVRDACNNLRNEMKAVLASEWKCDASAVSHEGSTFQGPGGATLSWAEACALLPHEKLSARGKATDEFRREGSSDGCQFAEVEVDTETGIVRVARIVAVQACGTPINRHTVENQICGGVLQGVSYALFEDRWLDGPTGAMVNPNLETYKIAGTKDVPAIVAVLDVEETDTGARSLGEPTTNPTAAAIANAVTNAIGARVRSLPITPARVLAALAARGGSA